MSKKICIIHANCQGDHLKAALESCPDFSRHFSVYKYTNYLKEHIPEGIFTRCDLLLYQNLSDKWEEHSSRALMSALPGGANAICIPNMFCKYYWPLWTNTAPVAFGDIFLEHLLGLGLNLDEAATIYLRGDLTAKYDLEALRRESLEVERRKEAGAPIKTTDIVEELWRDEQLFYTVNHPGEKLILHVAGEVLRLLGLGELPSGLREYFRADYEDIELPIHPRVGNFFRLPFAGTDRLYNIYGRRMIFEKYATCYIQCRLNKVDDFVSFLHLVPLD